MRGVSRFVWYSHLVGKCRPKRKKHLMTRNQVRPILTTRCGTLSTAVQPCETSADWNVLVTNIRTGEVTNLPHIGSAPFNSFEIAMSVALFVVETFDAAIAWGSISA